MSRRFAMAGLRALAALAAAACLSLPAWAAPALAAGRSVILEGELQVEVADFPDHTSATYHFLKTADGQRYKLKLRGDQVPRGVSGTRVRVKGRLADHELTAEASPVPTEPAPADVAAAMPYAAGVQKTAVILVNFQDKVTSPQTLSTVQNLVFSQVNGFYLENSFQTTSISGDVFGWYTIPVASTNCSVSTIKTYARNAAAAAGADLTAYSRFVYIFPNTSACAWAGYGTIGGSPTDAWINGYFDRRVIAHELGHNLGLRHAHSLECGPATIGNSCTATEYGDLIDTMGWGLYGHFSAYQKETLGWLNYGGMPPITTVQSSGSYAIAPYANGTGAAKALKILKGTNAATGEKTWYYLEYRQPTGYDGVLAGAGNLTSGVTIRTGSASGGGFLLDMTPGSDGSSQYNDFKDGALTVGQTFTDSDAGVAVTVTRADAGGASVDVALGSAKATCTRAKPSVLMSPYQPAAVAAGQPITYTVAVTNNDSAACGPSSFSLGKTLPSGWAGNLGAASLTIGAGSAASTTLAVTSPSSAVAGSYAIGASATSGTTSLGGSGSAIYGVSATTATGTLTESVATAQGSYRQGDTVQGTATVKLNGTPLANAPVTFKLTKTDGYLVNQTANTNASGQAAFQYKLSSTDPVGTYRLGATAANGVTTTYTSTSFSVASGDSATTTTSTPTSSLAETVTTNQKTYSRGSTAVSTATVTSNGTPVANAAVTFKLTKSNGELLYYTTTTGSTGQATYQYQIGLTDPTGYYRSGATASSGSMTAYTSATFQVQ